MTRPVDVALIGRGPIKATGRRAVPLTNRDGRMVIEVAEAGFADGFRVALGAEPNVVSIEDAEADPAYLTGMDKARKLIEQLRDEGVWPK